MDAYSKLIRRFCVFGDLTIWNTIASCGIWACQSTLNPPSLYQHNIGKVETLHWNCMCFHLNTHSHCLFSDFNMFWDFSNRPKWKYSEFFHWKFPYCLFWEFTDCLLWILKSADCPLLTFTPVFFSENLLTVYFVH